MTENTSHYRPDNSVKDKLSLITIMINSLLLIVTKIQLDCSGYILCFMLLLVLWPQDFIHNK
ncbi:hypothetical protein D3C78_551320 [compost metagenome]